MTTSEAGARSTRARLVGFVAISVVVLLALVLIVVWARRQAEPAPAGAGGNGPSIGEDIDPTTAEPSDGRWDTVAETALATRSMLQFPVGAAMPQTIVASNVPTIPVPAATRVNAAGVGEGFPATPEGAIGQLAALDVVALADLNPATYDAAYRSIALPAAPDSAATPLGSRVAKIYERVVMQGSDAAPIASRWQLAGAQVKGVTDAGRGVVVCVAGELQAAQANSGETGTGDCQSMRWTGTDWRIAPGPAAAPAPITWPGSTAFYRAGFRPTSGGPE